MIEDQNRKRLRFYDDEDRFNNENDHDMLQGQTDA